MVNIALLNKHKQDIAGAQHAYDAAVQAQADTVKALFTELLSEEVKPSVYIHNAFIKPESGTVEVYLIIRNPVPTEQDEGLIFKFDATQKDKISNAADLRSCLISGDEDFLV